MHRNCRNVRRGSWGIIRIWSRLEKGYQISWIINPDLSGACYKFIRGGPFQLKSYSCLYSSLVLYIVFILVYILWILCGLIGALMTLILPLLHLFSPYFP